MNNKFINNEIWVLTFGGGFQRSNAYEKSKEDKEKQRKEFRTKLRNCIENIVNKHYVNSAVVEQQHLEHINSIINFTKEYGQANNGLLTNNQLNFGIVQKVFNLYLKYQWCLGNINTPPHFPVDRIIQELLIQELKTKGLPSFKLKPWTMFESDVDYLNVIKHANIVLEKSKLKTLAELELFLFDRK